jgi:hypothetical protein
MNVRLSHIWLYSACATLGLLALLWVVSPALAQEPQGDEPPQADISAAATVASRINYQGELREGGVPVTGKRTMTVRLYSNSSCTSLLQTIVLGSVAVTDGRFSVAVNVNQALFNGQGVWLRLQVGTTQMSCQELMPVPYALSLRPSAIIRGAVSGTAFGNAVLNVQNTAPDGTGGYFTSQAGHGLSATTTSTQTNHYGGNFSARGGYGIYAQSQQNNAIRAAGGTDLSGVWQLGGPVGVAGLSATSIGVYGSSRDAVGVGGVSRDWYGVAGSSTNNTAGYFRSGGGHGIDAATTSSSSSYYGGKFDAIRGPGVYAHSQYHNAILAVGGSTAFTEVGYLPGPVGVVGLSATDVGVLGSSRDEAGVRGHSKKGVGVYAQSEGNYSLEAVSDKVTPIYAASNSGNLIELWDWAPYNLRFYVSNAGSVFADGPFSAGGADLAERVDATEELEPGDVVVINNDYPGQFCRTSQPYSTLVAGVISTEPSFVMNNGADDTRPLLALVGRVPVKVTAEEGGPIYPGDLLVSSSTPGHAMKAGADPPIGTIIGKALGRLEDGQGVIQMLVMLR